MAKSISSIKDLTPDAHNANRHSQRGMGMMQTSLEECGFGDSMTVDKHGNVISGNGRLETLADMQMEDAIVVQSDGTRPVIHQRTDLDLTKDTRAKRLAVLQNRVGQTNLEWDVSELAQMAEDGVELDDLFSEDEMTALLAGLEQSATDAEGGLDDKYSPEIGTVLYEPKTTSHKTKDLYDATAADAFADDIAAIQDADLRRMLTLRTAFFTAFNYSRIADYYAYQATDPEKRVFEKMALVLLDLGQLIEHGYSKIISEVKEENGFNDE